MKNWPFCSLRSKWQIPSWIPWILSSKNMETNKQTHIHTQISQTPSEENANLSERCGLFWFRELRSVSTMESSWMLQKWDWRFIGKIQHRIFLFLPLNKTNVAGMFVYLLLSVQNKKRKSWTSSPFWLKNLIGNNELSLSIFFFILMWNV